MAVALITGGTAGIGAAFARAYASRGRDLVLVARDAQRLRAAADELSQAYDVRVETLAADLSVPADVEHVAQRLTSTVDPIDTFVSNAGFGLTTPLLGPDLSEHENAIAVMVRAMLVLGAAAGRAMRARGDGRIIVISSLAGWTAQGNYGAIKAWTTVWGEGLANELRGSGVTVTVVTPGWVRTEFHKRAGINASAIPDPVWVDADRMVSEVLEDVSKGKVISVPTSRWKLAKYALRHLPRGAVRAVSRLRTERQ